MESLYDANQSNKRRRVTINEDDDEIDDDINSNPDLDYEDGDMLEDEGEDGEDLLENIYEDYVAVPELDVYDPSALDEEFQDSSSWSHKMEAKRAAEEELDQRDSERIKNRNQRLRDAAHVLEDERELQQTRMYRQGDSESDKESDVEEDVVLNIEAFDVPLKEWISQERTRREIKRRFKDFLLFFSLDNTEAAVASELIPENDAKNAMVKSKKNKRKDLIYMNRIRDLCSSNFSSLEVSFPHLGAGAAILAIWLADVPNDMLLIFDEVLTEIVIEMFPHYATISDNLKVRITDLPIDDRLRDLRQSDLNNLVRVTGVITRRTGVYPQMQSVAYDCKCGNILGPFPVENGIEMRPSSCGACGAVGGFGINPSRTKYGNYQKVTLQETPGSVPPGRVPRYKDVVLLGDLIDVARPGEEVDVTAIYAHSHVNSRAKSRDKSGFPVFNTTLLANCIHKRASNSNSGLSDEDKRMVRELATDPQIGERIFRSIAPSIYGHSHIKTAMALALFGGVAKDSGTSTHRVRGDINILLVGDPGTAKSQMLKYAQHTAPRAVYTTGKGASAVGLTAGVHRDPITKEWTLEGGALVLADQGVCLIDEFDKMKEQDRTSIHEAMEQQTISVSKAGIVCSLQARCAVFAAANPISGRYDASYSIAENVELTDPILQRFDILCVLQDIVDPVVDAQLANFVVNSHMKSHPDYQKAGIKPESPDGVSDNMDPSKTSKVDVPLGFADYTNDGPKPLDQDTLKKYIAYARAYVKPVVHDVDSEKIAKLYAQLREQSSTSGGVPIAVRHLESIIRMAEASAKMHLRDYVREDDVDLAIKITLQSFLQAQKVSVRKALQNKFKQFLIYKEENDRLLMHQLLSLMRDAEQYQTAQNRGISNSNIQVYVTDLQKRANVLNIFDLKPFFNSYVFKSHNMHLNEHEGLIIKMFD